MQIEAFVGRIYECAVLGDGWPALLGALAEQHGAQGGLLAASSQDGVRWTTSPSIMALYEAFLAGGWAEKNIRVPRLVARAHPGFLTDADIMTEEERRTLPLYRDFLTPLGFDNAPATYIDAGLGDGLVLSMEGFPNAAAAAAAIPALDVLRPHLARASALSARLALARVEAAAALLEQVGVAAALFGWNRRVLAANARFEAAMGGCRPQGLADWLDTHLARIGKGGTGGASRALPGLASGHAILHLYPVAGAVRDLFSQVVAIGVLATAGKEVPRPELIAALLDLTPAEARLAHAIAGGRTVEEAAAAFGISPSTARTQLREVFGKSGLSRQSELVALLIGLGAKGTGPA